MINVNAWQSFSIWENSLEVKELYKRRCKLEEPEMVCHEQAIKILLDDINSNGGGSLLDVGCGSGYFFHSINKRNTPLEYWGIDAAYSLIKIGQKELKKYGLPVNRLINSRIEDINGSFDYIISINFLTYCDNYHKALERMLLMAKKSVILRECIKVDSQYSYVKDNYLNEGVILNTYINHYGRKEIINFIRKRGYSVKIIKDQYSKGKMQKIIGYPHFWEFIVAERI